MRAIGMCAIACVGVAIAACKGAETTRNATPAATATTPAAPAAAAQLDLPRVDDDHAVAAIASVPKPAAIVWIDGSGAFQIARVDGAWTGALPTGARASAADLAAARLAVGDSTADDPPPPPEVDESGGTGTSIDIDEGKLGKKDSERALGQYQMAKVTDDPQLARQEAIEAAQRAGILRGPGRGGSMAGQDPALAAIPIAELRADLAVVVAAAPTSPALSLVRMIVAETGAIAVSNHGTLAVLARGYGHARDAAPTSDAVAWIELHVSADGVHVVETSKHDQSVVGWRQGALDRDGLRVAYAKLKAERFGGSDPDVQVRVGPDVSAQQLVDVLVALDGLGATRTTLGELIGTTDARLAKLADAAKPQVAIGQPNANGDLDKAIIRSTVKTKLAAISACYEKRLLAKPGLGGTVSVQFFITPSGSVATASASGVDPEVATCVAAVIRGLTFPKPQGGGGVLVNYPFTFRPSGMP